LSISVRRMRPNSRCARIRHIEEALELGQACGCSRETAVRILDYVYDRPPGIIPKEIGGTLVCLAALSQAYALDMDTIRERHARIPRFGVPSSEETTAPVEQSSAPER